MIREALIERIMYKQRILQDRRAINFVTEQKPGYIYPIALMEPCRELPLASTICGTAGAVWPKPSVYRQNYKDPAQVKADLK